MTEIVFGSFRQVPCIRPLYPAGNTLVSGRTAGADGLPAENRDRHP